MDQQSGRSHGIARPSDNCASPFGFATHARLRPHGALFPEGRPADGDQAVGGGRPAGRALSDPAGAGHWQDVHDGQRHRPDRPPGFGGSQQDVGSPAVQRLRSSF